MSPWQEFKAKREWGEPLDLFREADWSKRSKRSVAFPPLDGLFGFHAAFESLLLHQVKDQSLRLLWNQTPWFRIAGAVDVQVIIEIQLDRQISRCQPERKNDRDINISQKYYWVIEDSGGD